MGRSKKNRRRGRWREAADAAGDRPWGRTRKGTHVPVMAREVLGCLRPAEGQTVVDCTIGYGGHAARFCRSIGPTGRLIGLDVDADQLARTRSRLADASPQVHLHHANFDRIRQVLTDEGVEAADVIFADLGLSSMQIDDAERGVSYKHADAPLDMRMDRTAPKTAADVLAEISAEQLSAALAALADEEDHERIAAWIVRQREVAPLTRTSQLVRLIMDAKGLSKRSWRDDAQTRFGKLHPAAKTFQALRILVNDELTHLQRFLAAVPSCLAAGGRIGVISFHSGEDRLVKSALREGYDTGVYAHPAGKPLTPRPSEVRTNPRSASARFRWAQRA